ncbi:MAG: YiiX/YebB-like N1pC/P60 family cysteine hydrolase [Edaphocola sp.]
MLQHIVLSCFFWALISSAAAQIKPASLRSGDLIFQDLDCGPMCDAIEAVTEGVNGQKFSHIGLVYGNGDTAKIIEAIGEAVRFTPMATFLQRTDNPMPVARLRKRFCRLIPMALKYATSQIGVPYDDAFLYDNGKYYCSELIYDAFKAANKGKPFFKLFPMTFKQPGGATFFPVWVAYYRKLGMAIPEGNPGCNPGGLSRSRKIKILGNVLVE